MVGRSSVEATRALASTRRPVVKAISTLPGPGDVVTTPTAVDCKNNTVTISKYTYSTVDPNNASNVPVADVNPTTGQLCAGRPFSAYQRASSTEPES